MTTEKMFETACREKVRFPYKGQISVEDLWDLSVTQLDSIYKALNADAKKQQEESLLAVRTDRESLLDLQIEIVKYIVSVKLAENQNRLAAKERKEKRQKLMALLSEKQDADLRNKSAEEIQAMLAELDDSDPA